MFKDEIKGRKRNANPMIWRKIYRKVRSQPYGEFGHPPV